MTQSWSDIKFGVSHYFLILYFVRHRRHFLFIGENKVHGNGWLQRRPGLTFKFRSGGQIVGSWRRNSIRMISDSRSSQHLKIPDGFRDFLWTHLSGRRRVCLSYFRSIIHSRNVFVEIRWWEVQMIENSRNCITVVPTKLNKRLKVYIVSVGLTMPNPNLSDSSHTHLEQHVNSLRIMQACK